MELSLSVLLLAVASCLIAYIVSFYWTVRRYPPGPLPLPVIGNLHQFSAGNMQTVLEGFAEQFGPVFTVFLPAPMVVITAIAPMRDALVKNGEAFSGRPALSFLQILSEDNNAGVLGSEGATWRDQRRFAVQTLRDFGMGKNVMEAKVLASVETLLDMLDKPAKTGQPVDIKWPLDLCVGNVINELLLGYHWSADDCEKYRYFKRCMDSVTDDSRDSLAAFLVEGWPWTRKLPIIGWKGFGKPRENMKQIYNFMREEIAKHKRTVDYDAEPTDFAAAYLKELKKHEKAGNNDTSFNEQQMVNVVSEFWLAGLESTTTTLRWGVLYMVGYPEVQAKIQREIDDVIGREALPTMAHKTQMPYTSAAMLELQRCANIAIPVPHKTLADTIVNGLAIPAGTTKIPQIACVMFNSELFPDPTRFDPTRFLEANGTTLNKKAVDSWVPFSLGKRQCAGEALARMELFLILVSLLQRYTFRVPDSQNPPDLTPAECTMTRKPKEFTCLVELRR